MSDCCSHFLSGGVGRGGDSGSEKKKTSKS